MHCDGDEHGSVSAERTPALAGFVPLRDYVGDAGDKAAGLRWLADLGCTIPETWVVTGDDLAGDFEAMPLKPPMIVRPSVVGSRTSEEFSGVLASIRVHAADEFALAVRVATESAAQNLGPDEQLVLLLQPFLTSLVGGHVHVAEGASVARVAYARSPDEIASGQVSGGSLWLCAELPANSECSGAVATVVPSDAELHAFRGLLEVMSLLRTAVVQSTEIEWLFDGERLYLLQAQAVDWEMVEFPWRAAA
jgi:hypothetical protein